MKELIKRSLRNRRISTIAYSLSGIAMLELYVALYPSLSTQIQAYDEIAKAFPEALMKAFGIEELIFTTFEGYISTEHFSFIWPLLVIFLAIGYASSSIAGEIENRTIGLSLSQPISRDQYYWGKYFAGIVILAIFMVASLLVIFPLTAIHNVTINGGHIMAAMVIGSLFGLAVFSFGMAISSLMSERSHVSMATGGILVLMYVANIVAGLKPSLENLKYASIFNYFEISKAITKGQIKLSSVMVFLVIAVVCGLAGWIIFRRRDITV